MLAEFLQQTELAQLLRKSIWLYPVVNALHILGFSLLLGATITLDLRLLGVWSQTSLTMLTSILRPIMLAGLTFAILFGLLLFVTSAVDYLNASLFMTKLVLIGLAIVNAAVLNFSSYWHNARQKNTWGFAVKSQALLSIVLWVMVMFLGRFIGYR